ncbi:unnamed protein product, partial [Amoebophrya sp. A25]
TKSGQTQVTAQSSGRLQNFSTTGAGSHQVGGSSSSTARPGTRGEASNHQYQSQPHQSQQPLQRRG